MKKFLLQRDIGNLAANLLRFCVQGFRRIDAPMAVSAYGVTTLPV